MEGNDKAKTVSFINMKGGVGKTTLCINVAKQFSNNRKVLVIDMDPQFNATQSLLIHKSIQDPSGFMEFVGKDEELERELKEVESELIDDESNFDEEIKNDIRSNKFYKKLSELNQTALQMFESTVFVEENMNPNLTIKIDENLYLIPGDLQLSRKISGDTSDYISAISDHLEKHDLYNEFELILIDCPPTWSILTLSSLYASDAYLIPSKVDLYSSIGIQLLEDQIDEKIRRKSVFKNNGRELNRLGIVFTLVHKIKAEQTRIDKLKKEFKKVDFFKANIPHIPSVPSRFILYSDAKGNALYSELTNSLQRLTVEIEDKLKLVKKGNKREGVIK